MTVPIEVVLTNGLVFTLLLAILAFFIRRWFTSLDDKLKELCRGLERVREEKRDKVVCEAKMDDVWDRVHHHKHDPKGSVVVTG